MLPYPGILPDNPLYFVKKVRDSVLIFFSRDIMRKAELYILFSDKKMYMAIELSKTGKWSLVSQTVTESQNDFLKAVDLVLTAKKQGTSPQTGFLEKKKLSNEKHQEVIEMLLKSSTSGEQASLEKALKTTTTIRDRLSSL